MPALWPPAPHPTKHLFARGEKLIRVLEKTARESPSDRANEAVAPVRGLLDIGQAALKTRQPEQMAEVARRFTHLLARGSERRQKVPLTYPGPAWIVVAPSKER